MSKFPAASFVRACCLAALCILFPHFLYGQAAPETDLILLSPFPGTVAVSKTPKIVFRALQPLHEDGHLVLLDGDDITAMVAVDNDVYTYTPIASLGPGEHNLYVGAYTPEGVPVEKEFFFTSRHSDSFEEIYSDNRISTTLKTILAKNHSAIDEDYPESGINSPYTTFDNYLSSDSTAREGRWEASAKANARYYDQNARLAEPEIKGLSLLDFLVTANYTGENISKRVEVGDTTIEESINTVDYLTRRGGQASVAIGNVTLGGFGVLGTESGYEIDGLGFGFNTNDHIVGTSAKMAFFDQQMSVKTIYARGGEQGDSLGTWSEAGSRKGDVTGIVMETDFFNQLFNTDFEFDTVNYDPDTDDEDDTVYDKAYRIRIAGLTEKYDYELNYKYSGPQYEVVGNQSIVRDWAGFDFNSGMTYPAHALRLLANYSWDNVEDDILYARIYSFTGGLDYQYSGWERFPVNLLFEHNRQESVDEPIETESTSLDTNTLTGSVSYTEGPWSVEFMSSYSDQDDTTEYDYDTRLFTFSVVPSYTYAFFSILPSWSLNSSTDLLTDVRTDTNTLTLDIYSSFFKDTVICELGGTYDWTVANDQSVDLKYAALYGRLNYRLEKLWLLEDPTIALEYHYNRQEDKIYESTFWENVVSLVISTAIPYSL